MAIDLVVELATGGRSSRWILSFPAIEVSLLVIFMVGRITQASAKELEVVATLRDQTTVENVIALNDDYYLYRRTYSIKRNNRLFSFLFSSRRKISWGEPGHPEC